MYSDRHPVGYKSSAQAACIRSTLSDYIHAERGTDVQQFAMNGFENHERSHAQSSKPKKSVALSGVAAGNTALCTVGRSGNDLHYRGYDILDVADHCRIRGDRAICSCTASCRTRAELAAYKAKLKSLRGLRAAVKAALERAGVRASDGRDAHRRVGARHRDAGEGRPQPPGARDIADRLMASLGSMLLYWYHYCAQRQAHRGRDRRRLDRRPFPAPAARRSRASRGCARCTRR